MSKSLEVIQNKQKLQELFEKYSVDKKDGLGKVMVYEMFTEAAAEYVDFVADRLSVLEQTYGYEMHK